MGKTKLEDKKPYCLKTKEQKEEEYKNMRFWLALWFYPLILLFLLSIVLVSILNAFSLDLTTILDVIIIILYILSVVSWLVFTIKIWTIQVRSKRWAYLFTSIIFNLIGVLAFWFSEYKPFLKSKAKIDELSNLHLWDKK